MDRDEVLCALIKLRENEAWFATRYRTMDWVGTNDPHPSIHHGRNAAALHQAIEAVRFQQMLDDAHAKAIEALEQSPMWSGWVQCQLDFGVAP